ncbi:hypothetical protein BJX62DRAFT_233478 [Aspergillus germanicus]
MAGTEPGELSSTSEAGFEVYTPTITTIESTTSTSTDPSPSTTTHLSIYSAPFLNPSLLNNHAGSVSTVNTKQNETTLVFECTLGPSGCGPDGYGPRVTVTTDPTLFAYTASYAFPTGTGGLDAGYTRKRTYYVACVMPADEEEGSDSAECTTTWTEWASSAGTTTTARAVSSSQYPRGGVIVVPVTAGVEMLAGPSPAASVTTTAPLETGSDTGIPVAESESESGAGPSKALIAGAALGAVVACISIGVALWFWMRRRRRMKISCHDSKTGALIAELEGKDVHKAELPAREVAAVEVSGRGARDRVYELPTSPMSRRQA